MFDDKFVDELSEDPILATKEICEHFFAHHASFAGNQALRQQNYETYLIANGFFQAFATQNNLEFNLELSPSDGIDASISKIINFFKQVQNENIPLIVETYKSKYTTKFGNKFTYEFSESDFDRVQQIINELRELITKSNHFEEKYKLRLLKKVESLQSELHKKMSNLDRFLGFFVYFTLVADKLDKETKLFGKIKEFADIILRVMDRAEGIKRKFSLPFTDNNQLEE